MEEGNVRMIRDYFAGLDTHATLPSLQALVKAWRPDVIVRESWEFASTLVAEAEQIPLAEVRSGSRP